jgi:pimeloyl-ACP methyl ester carboxylesterase
MLQTVLVPSTDGVRIALHELGGSNSSPLLLIAHANGFHGRCYQPMVDAGLSERFRCVALDLRGHGDSETPPGAIGDWAALGQDVEAALDGLGAEPGAVFGFGHSFGGAGLLMAEVTRPGTFAALWLYEPVVPPPGMFPPPDSTTNPMADGAERRREIFDSYEAAIANFASKPPMNTFDPEALRAYVEGGFAPQPDGTVLIKCRGRDEAAFYRSGATNHTYEHLAEVACPVTVAVGEPGFGPPAFAPAVAEALPRGALVELPHLNHFGPLQAPAEIAKAVLHAFR